MRASTAIGSHPGAAGRSGSAKAASHPVVEVVEHPRAALVLAQLVDDPDVAVGQQLRRLLGLGLR